MTRYRISLEAHEHADESTSERPVLLSRPFCVDVDVDANSPEEASAILGCILTELVAESRDRFGFGKQPELSKELVDAFAPQRPRRPLDDYPGLRDAYAPTSLNFGNKK